MASSWIHCIVYSNPSQTQIEIIKIKKYCQHFPIKKYPK